jgi:hypothetical protein
MSNDAAAATCLLEWLDGRWHLDGRGIHAGASLEFRWPDGTWERVRIESGDCGRKLYAHFDYHGLALRVRVVAPDACDCELRWPIG